MRKNRIFFITDKSEFAEGLYTKLASKYDVDLFTNIGAVTAALEETHPIALLSTVNSEENYELMRAASMVLFKSQYLENYNTEDALKYGRYCVCVAGRCWLDEILNASYQLIDRSIIKENVQTAVKERTKSGAIAYDLNYKTVRTKTKESTRMPAPHVPEMLNKIVKEA